jgi:UDP-GlcNAc:undecaprenyl-phosphate GlcNAc-1-phosphate transferase
MKTDFPVSIFQGAALGLVLSLIACLLSIVFARKTGLIDVPGREPHKQHSQPTPVAGGIALFIVLIIGWLFNIREFGDLWKVAIPTLIIFGVGLWDDYRRVRFWVKLVVEIVAVGILIGFGIQVRVIQILFSGLPLLLANGLDILITMLWLVGMTNAYNFVDSMDGLATGIAIIASIFLAFTSLFSGQIALAHFMAFLAAACYGLHFFNSHPARLFLGDSGALSLGFLLATTSMLYNPQIFPQPSSWFVPVMILGLPIFDICLVIVSRLRRDRPIYQADRAHTYHRLVMLGFSATQAVSVLHMVSLLLGCLAFVALNQEPLIANIIFGSVVLAGIISIIILDNPRHWPQKEIES